MHDYGVFSDWVTAGAAFGVKAFAALAGFALICGALLGLLMLGVRIIKEADDANERERRH
jgi:hypothetical protein